MEALSVFDIFKIGVGPSSSHTLGPWKAALQFAKEIELLNYDGLRIDLFGSLSKTGRGHCTDVAVQLGLAGHQPEIIDTTLISELIASVQTSKTLVVNNRSIKFDPLKEIVFRRTSRKEHPNTLTFTALLGKLPVHTATYYSIGGGFIEREGASAQLDFPSVHFPFPIQNARDLEKYTQQENCHISDIVWRNELSIRRGSEIKNASRAIFQTMLECVYRGCTTGGILPGGLNVKRRAKALCSDLLGDVSFDNLDEWASLLMEAKKDFRVINKWVSCFALAVNEENANLGRVVTSPTNGAAGVIPAVLLYAYFFCDLNSQSDVERFIFTAGEVGCIFKKGATISAAVGGCQAEIGVSSAMAAAGLTEIMGGSPGQALMAAEIAMEHHLGLTCDPIGGLVQIPCIERNAMGAIKAITASNLALSSKPEEAKVNLDVVVKTMWDTAQAMNRKFKETSEGGLAINLPVVYPEC